MKKIMILLLLCTVSLGTYAQEKGEKFLNASVGVQVTRAKLYQNDEVKEPSAPDLTLSLSLGIHGFVAKNFRSGLNLGGSFLKDENIELDCCQKTKTVLVGPEFAYYVTLCDKFYYVPQLGIYYTHYNISVKSNTTGSYQKFGSSPELIYNGFDFVIQPLQFEMRLNKHIGLSMNVFNISFYDLIQKKEEFDVMYPDNKSKTTGFDFDFGVYPEVGLHIYF